MAFLVLIGGVLLVKGREFMPLLDMIFGENSGAVLVILVGALSGMASMTDPAVPSVSLEGKSIWILQSLPLDPWDILKAKMSVQLKLTLPAMLLAVIGAGFALKAGPTCPSSLWRALRALASSCLMNIWSRGPSR